MKSFKPILAVCAFCACLFTVPYAQADTVTPAPPPPSADLTASVTPPPTVPVVPEVVPDITTVTHTTIDTPMIQEHMTPQLQAMMDKFSDTTMYMSGHKARVENGLVTMIMNSEAGKMWSLDPAKQIYYITTYSPDQAKAMMQKMSKSPTAGGQGMTYKVKDTGRTTTVLGHVVRHYILTMQMTVMGSQMDMTEDILAAQDIPLPEFSKLSSAASEIKGLPLVTTLKSHGGPGGDMTMKMVVTSISTDPIAASEFRVPAGYTLVKAPDAGSFGAMMIPH